MLATMEDSIVQFIVALSGLISAVSGIVVYALSRMHATGKAEELRLKVAGVADSLQQTDDWVAEHEVQLKTGVKVVEELAPEAKALIDENKAKVDALTAEVEKKTAALNELKKTLPPAS